MHIDSKWKETKQLPRCIDKATTKMHWYRLSMIVQLATLMLQWHSHTLQQYSEEVSVMVQRIRTEISDFSLLIQQKDAFGSGQHWQGIGEITFPTQVANVANTAFA